MNEHVMFALATRWRMQRLAWWTHRYVALWHEMHGAIQIELARMSQVSPHVLIHSAQV